jgi:hypothetical protein
MIRNIKVLGLAVVAVFAFGAITASAAFAEPEFHSEVASTKYTAEQDGGSQIFVTPAGTVTCTDVTGEATTTTTTNKTITATNIKYFNTNEKGEHVKCITKTLFGNIEVGIDFTTDECDYLFHATGGVEPNGGTVDVVCNKAGGITISGPGCSITVPGGAGQNKGLKEAIYDNKEAGAKRDVTITAKVKGISGTATGFLCSKEGAFTTGEYTGNVTVKGFKDEALGAQVGIWRE